MMKKISWKVYISLSLIYLLSCFGLINLIGQNSLKLDQQRITAEANQILQEISTDSSLRFPDNIVIQPEKTSNSATKAIQNGASYFQTSSQGKLTMTFPINEDGKIRSYLSITETITSTHFSTTLSLLVLTLLFLSSLTFLLLHSRKLK
ncbi:MAG: hypothetical protein LBI13_08670, partial [Streptococcaceae bacterium]|nr:hypothetical protein [Streptococcaceae bacterium]